MTLEGVEHCILYRLHECWPTVDRVSADTREIIGEVSTVSAKYGRGIAELKSLDTCLNRLSTYWPTIDRLSTGTSTHLLRPRTVILMDRITQVLICSLSMFTKLSDFDGTSLAIASLDLWKTEEPGVHT